MNPNYPKWKIEADRELYIGVCHLNEKVQTAAWNQGNIFFFVSTHLTGSARTKRWHRRATCCSHADSWRARPSIKCAPPALEFKKRKTIKHCCPFSSYFVACCVVWKGGAAPVTSTPPSTRKFQTWKTKKRMAKIRVCELIWIWLQTIIFGCVKNNRSLPRVFDKRPMISQWRRWPPTER